MTIIYFILILGITIFIHELGHFMFAKKFGVHVYEFSLGMGPRLFKFNRKNDETDYCIRLFPIGGFVSLAGEGVEVDENIDAEKSLQSKPAFQRFMIMVAGVMMNFLLAIVIYFILGLFNYTSTDNVYVENSSIQGLSDNSEIVSVNGNFVNNYDKFALEMTIAGSEEIALTVKNQDGNKVTVKVNPIAVGKSNLLYQKDYGFDVKNLTIKNSKVTTVPNDSTIISVGGINVDSYIDLLNELSKYEDKVTLTIKSSDGNSSDVGINIKENKDDELIGYSYGFDYNNGKIEKGFIPAIKYAFFKFFSVIEQMFFTIFYLITGKISLSMLSGPVGIFSVVSVYSQYGFSRLVSLLALICINVGFINILPLPAFDGGHILFIIIEKIRGKKIDPKIENTIHNIVLILLLILMVFVTYNDIMRLF